MGETVYDAGTGILAPPCIHTDGKGLCQDCLAEFAADPEAYLEYGEHPAGIERWRAVQEEMAAHAIQAEAARLAGGSDPEIPF
jgi:hypothetical protein